MSNKIKILFLLSPMLFFSTANAGDFYIAVSGGATSIEGQVETRPFLPTPSATSIVGVGTAGVVSDSLTFDELFEFLNSQPNGFVAGPLIPLNVRSDDRDASYELAIGYHLFDNFDIELGYADLGSYATEVEFSSGTLPTLAVGSPFGVVPSGSLTAPSFTPFVVALPTLNIEQASFRLRYHRSLSDQTSWLVSAGVVSTNIEADFGSGFDNIGVSTFPMVFLNRGSSIRETGVQLGLGLAWAFRQDFSVNFNVRWNESDPADLASALLTLEYNL